METVFGVPSADEINRLCKLCGVTYYNLRLEYLTSACEDEFHTNKPCAAAAR